MENMNVINFASTGHILGVVTRTAQEGAPPMVEQVAPSGVSLRNIRGDNFRATIGAKQLAVTQVEYDSRVLYSPHLFALDGGLAEQQLSFVPPAGPSATLDGVNLVITLPNAVVSDTEIFVHISGTILNEPIVRSETMLDGSTSTGNRPLQLSSGDYMIAIFVPGYATVLIPESVV